MPKTVEITALDDGTFTVELDAESGATEGAEPPEGTPADMQEDASNGEQSQSFPDIKGALMAAAKLLIGAGAPKMGGEDEAMQAGFKQVRGTPDEQMAASQYGR